MQLRLWKGKRHELSYYISSFEYEYSRPRRRVLVSYGAQDRGNPRGGGGSKVGAVEAVAGALAANVGNSSAGQGFCFGVTVAGGKYSETLIAQIALNIRT